MSPELAMYLRICVFDGAASAEGYLRDATDEVRAEIRAVVSAGFEIGMCTCGTLPDASLPNYRAVSYLQYRRFATNDDERQLLEARAAMEAL